MYKEINYLQLNEACRAIHQSALDKGFTSQPVPTNLMLIVTELSEACEADRKGRHAILPAFYNSFPCYSHFHDGSIILKERDDQFNIMFRMHFDAYIKDTFEDEIADAMMRLMDLCAAEGIDIENHIKLKAAYNQLRPPKHGKEY